MTGIKICGIKTPDAMTAALEAGADFVGLVFVPTSPRYVAIEVAAYLARYVPAHVKIVGLFVDSDAAQRAQILDQVRLDMIQLHGHETPEDCMAIRQQTQLPVIKALEADRLDEAARYEAACDWLLIDTPATKAPQGLTVPITDVTGMTGGGSGVVFDWGLLAGHRFSKPWMLAGGLNANNVAEAITRNAPDAVDVSSGVEAARGEKDPAKIRAFIEAVRQADQS